MKRLISIGLLMCFVFACDEMKIEHDTHKGMTKSEITKISTQFNDMFSDVLKHVSKSSSLVSIYDSSVDSLDVILEVGEISRVAKDYLSVKYFEGENIDLNDVSVEDFIISPEPGSRVSAASIFEISNIYNENQKELLVPFTENILDINNENDGFNVINDFKEKVYESISLTYEEKVQLIEYSSGMQSILAFVNNGDLDRIQSKIFGKSVNNGRQLECNVNMRDVWAGAVIGLAYGAIRGGVVGGTTGTFTVPVLGTAVGGVSGAVFGGAVGFVEGAITATVGSLLLTCGRSNSKFNGYTSASCKKMAKMGLRLPTSCYNNLKYKLHKDRFITKYKLKGGK